MPPFLPNAREPISPSHPLALRSLLPSVHKLAARTDKDLLPTRTLPPSGFIPRSLASLFRRQVVTITATANPTTNTVTATATPLIPANYAGLDSGPTPGTVVGIVFGSVAGFLLLLWLIYTCFGLGGGQQNRSSVVQEEVIRRHSRSPSRRRSSPRRSPSFRSESEVIEQRSTRTRERTRTPPPPRREMRERDTVIIEETIRHPRTPPPPPEDDMIEVIEEHDSPPRPRRKKDIASGFRTIDPQEPGGGNRPLRKVSRR